MSNCAGETFSISINKLHMSRLLGQRAKTFGESFVHFVMHLNIKNVLEYFSMIFGVGRTNFLIANCDLELEFLRWKVRRRKV